MEKILIFSTEPNGKNNEITPIKYDLIGAFALSYNDPIKVYINRSNFSVDSELNYIGEKKIPIMIFINLDNFKEINKFSDLRLIKSLTFLKTGLKNNVPHTLVFSCNFPISDIPINEIHKFRIINIS